MRKLIGVAGDIADIGYSVPEDVKAAVDEAEQMVFNVGARRTAVNFRLALAEQIEIGSIEAVDRLRHL